MRRALILMAIGALLTLAWLALTGCAPAVQLDNSARLIARPDFSAARDAAPEWCRDALKTINALEHQIESQ